MPSTFAWLDYSESERRRALDVIGLFKQRETRDELGIASVRDAFAELFSPGTSTIQTRAKYFLLVPWMYLDFERRSVGGARIARRARRFEIKLIDGLAGSDDATGVIGIASRSELQRLPSNIYWAGLRRWGILLFAGSQPQYHRNLDNFYDKIRRLRDVPKDAEGTQVEPVNWHPHVPDPPEGFPEGVSLTLTRKEAEYLRERIRSTCQGSLLAQIVELGERWEGVDFPWQHPAVERLSPLLVERLEHARKFSEVMHGAALLYNLMLAEAIEREDWIAAYEGAFEEWAARAGRQEKQWRTWQRDDFWKAVHGPDRRIPVPTRRFVDTWIALVTAHNDPGALRDNREGRQLIRHREAQLKGGRARLQSRRHLELWRGDSGSGQLNFRWSITQTIALDILRALG